MITRDDLRQLGILLRPLKTRIANSIARAVVQNVSNGTKMQLLQLGVLDGEDIDDCENFQGYGFCSVPLPGAEAVVIFPNGDRGHPLVVGIEDRRHRPTEWEPGETGTYNNAGAVMHHKADGTTEIHGGGTAAELAYFVALEQLKDIFTTAWVVAPNDGGAALKTALEAWSPTGTTKLKAE